VGGATAKASLDETVDGIGSTVAEFIVLECILPYMAHYYLCVSPKKICFEILLIELV